MPLRRHEPDRPDEIKGDENTELNAMIVELEDPKVTEHFYGLAKKMDMIVPACFSYSQCQTTKDAEPTAGLYELRKMMIVAGPASSRYFQCQITDVVTVLAYFNYSQYQTSKNAAIITRYQVLRDTKGTKPAALIGPDKRRLRRRSTWPRPEVTDFVNVNL